GDIQLILLVEDSLRHYSMFLPLLYSEIVRQTQRLISEELNDINKRLRMRARPKVLLVHSYDDAFEIYKKYKNNMIAIISDVRFPKMGVEDKHAGIKLLKIIKEEKLDIPMLLQSSEEENSELAKNLEIEFLCKQSTSLLTDIREFLLSEVGFGDFSFKNKKNIEIARVKNILQFKDHLKDIPIESLMLHGKRNNFSSWLFAHGEFEAARKIRKVKVSDFETDAEFRDFLYKMFEEIKNKRDSGKIINFDPEVLDIDKVVIKLSEGSLGGKGRGLAFLNSLFVAMEIDEQFPDVLVRIPKTFIIGTDEFDSFLENNSIDREDLEDFTDSEIQEIFLAGRVTSQLRENLYGLLEKVDYPLAIRSSGLLEDSQSQPFAGIYKTFMIANDHSLRRQSMQEVLDAIKLVYASVFEENSRRYIDSVNFKVEEEKMAIIVQEVCGSHKDGYFYPDISGIAQSNNFYPTGGCKYDDSIAEIALGLGKSVVEGNNVYRFTPKKPKSMLSTPQEIMKNMQKYFYAIKLKTEEDVDLSEGEEITLEKLSVRKIANQGKLDVLCSTWEYDNSRFTENKNAEGMKVLTFSKILKYDTFPLAKILEKILDIAEKAMGSAIEMEFAADLSKKEFYFLQVRPITIGLTNVDLEKSKIVKENCALFSEKALGNGVYTELSDVIYVNLDTFSTTKTHEMVEELNMLNDKFSKSENGYVLIGPGRWGTREHFLGIPVEWRHINNVKIIVEQGIKNLNPEPSQGTHFFHNVVSLGIGYFSISLNSNGWVDYEWLETQHIVEKTKYFVHVRTKKKLVIDIDGKQGLAVVRK
ncbi:MAG: PEP/pyruvate-binding domain-containing protein, partial [Candidatus Cloacimonadota bacterium]|nr:PEP/pyruvate-binding domain-containing protein [Candidatus Cloacimonadota bacterium]